MSRRRLYLNPRWPYRWFVSH